MNDEIKELKKSLGEESKTNDDDSLNFKLTGDDDDLAGIYRSKCEVGGEAVYFDSIFEDHIDEEKEGYK